MEGELIKGVFKQAGYRLHAIARALMRPCDREADLALTRIVRKNIERAIPDKPRNVRALDRKLIPLPGNARMAPLHVGDELSCLLDSVRRLPSLVARYFGIRPVLREPLDVSTLERAQAQPACFQYQLRTCLSRSRFTPDAIGQEPRAYSRIAAPAIGNPELEHLTFDGKRLTMKPPNERRVTNAS